MNTISDTAYRHGPQTLSAMIVLSVAGVWANGQVWIDILDNGLRRPEAVHIFMAIPLCAWVVWGRRANFAACRPRPSIIGPLLIAIGWAASAYGYHSSGQTLWHGGVLLILIGGIVSVVGRDLFRYFLPAVCALSFIVPAPGFLRHRLEGPLEYATAWSGKFIFDRLGMDVELETKPWAFGIQYYYRHENMELFLNDLSQRTQMFFVVLAVAFAFAFGPNLRSHVGRVCVFLLVPLLTILCNVIRTIPTFWYYAKKAEDASARYHLFTVWLLVPVAYFILWGLAVLVRWVWSPDAEET